VTAVPKWVPQSPSHIGVNRGRTGGGAGRAPSPWTRQVGSPVKPRTQRVPRPQKAQKESPGVKEHGQDPTDIPGQHSSQPYPTYVPFSCENKRSNSQQLKSLKLSPATCTSGWSVTHPYTAEGECSCIQMRKLRPRRARAYPESVTLPP
jgi:hypothetical protein